MFFTDTLICWQFSVEIPRRRFFPTVRLARGVKRKRGQKYSSTWLVNVPCDGRIMRQVCTALDIHDTMHMCADGSYYWYSYFRHSADTFSRLANKTRVYYNVSWKKEEEATPQLRQADSHSSSLFLLPPCILGLAG